MDQAKFKKIEDAVRIGGKGSVRRKHKRAPASTALEEKRLQTTLTKLSLFQMPGIEKMTLLMGDKTEIVIPGPKVQGSSGSNLLVVSGVATRVASAAKPSPPPPPMPALIVEVKPPKKPKKPRNRVRARNKRAQQLLDGGAGDAGSIGVLGAEGEGEGSDQSSPDDRSLGAGSLDDGGGDDSGDSEKTTVPSDGSDMDQTIVGDIDDFDIGDDPVTGTGNKEADAEVKLDGAVENKALGNLDNLNEEDEADADGDDEGGDYDCNGDGDGDGYYDDDDDRSNDNDGDSEEDQMTLDDILSSLDSEGNQG